MSDDPRARFTLPEVLVVVCIIAVLAGLLLPAMRRVRGPAARMHCTNKLKQLILAVHEYESTGRVPPDSLTGPPEPPVSGVLPTGCYGPGATPDARLSCMVTILPFLEQGNLYQQFDPQRGYAGNLPAAQTVVKTLLRPSASNDAYTVTNYVAMAGIGPEAASPPAGSPGNGFMGTDRQTALKMITDGTSNTIALMETRADLRPWARGGPSTLRGFDPADTPPIGEGRPFGWHNGVAMAAMADGSARAITSSVDPKQLAAAVTIAGGEPPDLE